MKRLLHILPLLLMAPLAIVMLAQDSPPTTRDLALRVRDDSTMTNRGALVFTNSFTYSTNVHDKPFASFKNIIQETNQGSRWTYQPLDYGHPTNILMTLYHEPIVTKTNGHWEVRFKP